MTSNAFAFIRDISRHKTHQFCFYFSFIFCQHAVLAPINLHYYLLIDFFLHNVWLNHTTNCINKKDTSFKYYRKISSSNTRASNASSLMHPTVRTVVTSSRRASSSASLILTANSSRMKKKKVQQLPDLSVSLSLSFSFASLWPRLHSIVAARRCWVELPEMPCVPWYLKPPRSQIRMRDAADKKRGGE